MGFFDIFSGKGPEKAEEKGDAYFRRGEYGLAKLEYGAALEKLGESQVPPRELQERLKDKIITSKEALALQHTRQAQEILESGYYEEAQELFSLARELTDNPELKKDIEEGLTSIRSRSSEEEYIEEQATEREDIEKDEYFRALCGALSKEVRQEYLSYGRHFREGFVALNMGNFERAVEELQRAMEENSPSQSLIPLELGTAYLNLGEYEQAEDMLRNFITEHPLTVEGYQVLCELFWVTGKFDEALEVLGSCPSELAESPPLMLLKGETYYQSGTYEAAESVYLDYFKLFGRDNAVLRSLARTYEAMGDTSDARELYGELLNACATCGSPSDPFVKQRYADLCYESGEYTKEVLELYLALTVEDPANSERYYERIAGIYEAQGNEDEAGRYRHSP